MPLYDAKCYGCHRPDFLTEKRATLKVVDICLYKVDSSRFLSGLQVEIE